MTSHVVKVDEKQRWKTLVPGIKGRLVLLQFSLCFHFSGCVATHESNGRILKTSHV